MSQSVRENRRAAGFTLVEVVVALTLLSLILLGLVSALRSFGQTGARLEAQTLAADDLRLVSGLLQRTIARASPRTHEDPYDQTVHTWFNGGFGGLTWLGQLPARNGVGGLSHLHLFVGAGAGPNDQNRLLLQIIPYTGDKNRPDWGGVESRTLLDDIDTLQLQYQGVDETDWLDAWADPNALPQLVRLAVTVRGRPWPPIIVRLEQAEPRNGVRRSDRSSSLR